MTTSGEKCVFPFKYRQKTCSGPTCCNLDNDPKGPWCATAVKENGYMLTSKAYGYCEKSCHPPGKKMVACSDYFSHLRGKEKVFAAAQLDLLILNQL